MAVKKPVRRKPARAHAPASVKTSARVTPVLRPEWSTGTPMITAAAVFVAGVGLLAVAYQFAVPAAPARGSRTALAAASREPQNVRTSAPVARHSSAAGPSGMQAANPGGAAPVRGTAPAVVTITGCLERSDEEFRLTDTSGVSAPKSRSWKSGFLAKRPAAVAVVAAPAQLNLTRHVGQRVSLTGTLVDREMRVRTLRRVSASCESGSRVAA